jgi:hypothetical protein
MKATFVFSSVRVSTVFRLGIYWCTFFLVFFPLLQEMYGGHITIISDRLEELAGFSLT